MRQKSLRPTQQACYIGFFVVSRALVSALVMALPDLALVLAREPEQVLD
jgi:hypothetical protein